MGSTFRSQGYTKGYTRLVPLSVLNNAMVHFQVDPRRMFILTAQADFITAVMAAGLCTDTARFRAPPGTKQCDG